VILSPTRSPADCALSNLLLSPTGATQGDAFGTAVSQAGDFNGDGYGDVIVGAPGNDQAGPNAGRAFLYFGGPFADSPADVMFTGEAAGNGFGQSVGAAGDVNGDGFDDVIIGAPYHDAHGSGSGRAYVFFGGTQPNNVADLTLDGLSANDFFGYSVAGAGDVNHDGFDDVIVGAYAGGTTKPGRTFLFLGGSPPNTAADLTMTGVAGGDDFGVSVSGAGDVNGDSFADMIVGAWGNDAGGTDAGRAYVYFGGASLNSVADVVLTGQGAGDEFGTSVSGAGDVNKDGFADVIVGAPYNAAAGTLAGRAYVYYGGVAPDATADLTLTSPAAGNLFGFSVSGAGDVNGDGFGEVIVGAYANDIGGDNAGRAYLYLGAATPDVVPDALYTGAVAGDNLGFAVSGGSDVNGDGDADPIVGAPNNDAGGLGAGRAYVFWLQRPDVTVDGSADASYGAPLVTQSLQTSFGNSTTGVVDFANGSELDQAFARLTPRALCLLLAGNLEANFKKLAIFLDTKLGEGQNRLRGDNPNIDGNSLNRMGDDGSGNGMRFDSDFAPDYYLTVTGGNTGGGHYEILVKWAELRTNGGGLGRFLGRTDAVSNGVLVTGDNPFDVRVTINNSNTAGVTAGTLGGSGAGVTTGIELWIPVQAIGCPTGTVRVAAFVNGSFGDLVSNQVLGSLPIGTTSLGDPRFVDFAAIPGLQYFWAHREDLVSAPPPDAGAALAARVSPNPFATRTEVAFTMTEPGGATIDAYDVAGHHVERVLDGTLPAGPHAITWHPRDASGRSLPPGVYYLKIASGGAEVTRKVVALR
jgi:hypothetical protein